MEKLYSIDLYWRKRQKLKGFPSIEHRAALYRQDGRLDQWLQLIKRFGPNSGRVIEIGCSPGVLVEELSKLGFDCVGVEVSSDVATWIKESTDLDIRSGFFPGLDLPVCDLFLAFDVLEHSPCPERFIAEVQRLLVPGGIAIIQTAIDRYNYCPPFGTRFDLFDDLEHCFLFTDRAMDDLAKQAGLNIINDSESLWIGGEVCVFQKPY
jgi:SAM-dependent methyltransferase